MWTRPAVALLAAMSFVPAAPSLANGLTVVRPTGDPGQDVAAVRAAVQVGGTILLKATDRSGRPKAFDFGDYPVSEIDWDESGAGYVALGIAGEIVPVTIGTFTVYVSLGNDVRLLGENVGGAMTTVRGGTIPIRNFAPRTIPGVGVREVYGLARVAVEGIRFTEPALQAMYTTQLGRYPEVRALVEARGVAVSIDIRRNHFVDVQPAYSAYWYALGAVTDGPAGPVRVEDNLVRFTPGRWDAAERAYEQANGLEQADELWEGVSIADLNARGVVARNRIEGVDLGLLVYFDGRELVDVTDNRVELRPEGLVGIYCQANHRYVVERNTVIAAGANPDGIILWASDPDRGINGARVRFNRVVLDGSDFGGISLIGKGTANDLSLNWVEGSAAYALGLVTDNNDPEKLAVKNVLAANKLSDFVPRDSPYYGDGATIFLDTHTRANLVLGRSGIVKDLGQDNVVAGPR